MGRGPDIHFRNVSRSFGPRKALRELTYHIEAGSKVALVGSSGSGKSTFLRLCLGALAASDGEVEIDGSDLRSMKRRQLREHRRRSAVVDQEPAMVDDMRVHQCVLSGMLPRLPLRVILSSALWPQKKDEVAQLLSPLGLGDRQWDRIAELSGGERQRVCVARALAADPGLLAADEATSSLDPTTAEVVLDALFAGAADSGATFLISTHRIEECKDRVDQIVGIRQGELLWSVSPGQLSAAMLSEVYSGQEQ